MERGQLYDELVNIIGEAYVSGDEADLIPYMKDSYSLLMKKSVPRPDFVVLPGTAEEVRAVVALANESKVPIYPRSFGVNIAGSALPYQGGLVLDLKRMNRILEINPDTMTATIEPGVSWGKLRKEANPHGLDIIPIGGPYQTSPVGNFLLTNITPYSTKYPADRVVTFEAVLPNGQILRTGSRATDFGNTYNPYFRYAYGPDLAGMFRGSLGNFGVITKMTIRLRPLAEIEENLIFGFQELPEAVEAMKRIERLEISRHSIIVNNFILTHLLLTPAQMRQARGTPAHLRYF